MVKKKDDRNGGGGGGGAAGGFIKTVRSKWLPIAGFIALAAVVYFLVT